MSLKKIAQIVGVSPSTVSRVLNDSSHKCATDEIKDRIWSVAKEINYIPNQEARNLKLGKRDNVHHYTIDILLARYDSLESDPFFKETFRSIETMAHKEKCHLGEIHNTGKINLPTEKYPSRRGLIILGRCSVELIKLLKQHYRHIISIGRNTTNFEIDEILCDGANAAILAMDYLISLGHKKIAYIGDCSYESRYIGYQRALIQHKLPLDFQYIHSTNQTKVSGYQAMRDIMESNIRPTAIFCANDFTALGVLDAYHDLNQGDYQPSIISIDNIEASQLTTPLLTTVNIPKTDMGRLAVSLLLDRMEGNHYENIKLELPCSLVIRDSCYINI